MKQVQVNALGFIYISLLFFTVPSLASPENDHPSEIKDWKFVRAVNGVYTYKLKENKNVIGTFHSRKFKKSADWDSIDPDEFFKKINKEKSLIMALINISDWRVNQFRWEKQKEFFELQMKGSYTDPQGRNIYFYENHLYSSKNTQQILVISPHLIAPKQESFRSFLHQAKRILNH